VITSAVVEAICHATENEEKLKKAIEEVLNVEMKEEKLRGHWGNPIIILRCKLKGRKAKEVAEKIAQAVRIEDFEERSEKGAFYIRLDKKSFLHGNIRLGNDVRVVFHLRTYPASAKKVAEKMEKFWRETRGE